MDLFFFAVVIRFSKVSDNWSVQCFKFSEPEFYGDLVYRFRKIVGKKGKRKVQGVPQSQTVALPRPQEEEETDKSKQAQTAQTYEKH